MRWLIGLSILELKGLSLSLEDIFLQIVTGKELIDLCQQYSGKSQIYFILRWHILIGLFILLTSIFLFQTMYQVGSFNNVLANMGFISFIVPVLTMRILAEDRKNGTEVLLITSPASITSIVVGKYLAVCFVFFVLTVLSFVYPVVLLAFGATFTAELVGGYIGFILLGMTFISVGVFCSSLTESQVVAVIVSYVMLLIMWLAGSLGGMLGWLCC